MSHNQAQASTSRLTGLDAVISNTYMRIILNFLMPRVRNPISSITNGVLLTPLQRIFCEYDPNFLHILFDLTNLQVVGELGVLFIFYGQQFPTNESGA